MQKDEEQEITIEEFFALCEDGGTYQIHTPDGWQDIGSLVQKRNKDCYKLILEDGQELGCSADHYIWTSDGVEYHSWKKAEDINVQDDLVRTMSGWRAVVAKESIGVKDTFDLEVKSLSHKYYSNGIVSHNTGKSMISDAVGVHFEMPLLRLDIGALFSAHIGESEENTRLAIQTAEAIAPCVLGKTSVVVDGKDNTIEDVFDRELTSSGNDTEFTLRYPRISKRPGISDSAKQTVVCIDEKREVKIRGIVNNEVSDIPLLALIRTKAKGNLIRIRTKSGREITTTQNHLLMNEKNMKKAKDFCVGDSISIVDNNSIQGDIDEEKDVSEI